VPNKNRKRAPAKRPAPKLPAKESAVPTPDQDTPTPEPVLTVMVEPLNQNTLNLVMQIIDNADFKGHEVSKVLAVKLELARVAGLRTPGDGQ